MSNSKALANRRNAQKSTGPRDTTVTRLNAVKHGLMAANLTAFDVEIYGPMLEHFRRELQPASEIEDMLVQRIALYGTRLHRAASLSAEYMRDAMKPSIADVNLKSTLLDQVAFAATGEVPQKAGRLADLKAAVENLPDAINAFIEGGGSDASTALVAALQQFSVSVEALPGGKKDSRDTLKIVETLETRFQRYETQLENRFLRLLNEYERIQRMRNGDAVPAPLNVNVLVEAGGHDPM